MAEPKSGSFGESLTVNAIIERGAERAVERQRGDGSFPAGRNYTYNEAESPVKTTSRWLITLCKAYENTGKAAFERAASDAMDYLLSANTRPGGYTFYCRDALGKDRCNGLVGQSWPIHALSYSTDVLGREDGEALASALFSMHPFDDDVKLWERVETDGRVLGYDRTLNHQILFAARSTPLSEENATIRRTLLSFLDGLISNMDVHPNGLIKHFVQPPLPKVLRTVAEKPRTYKLLANQALSPYYSRSESRRRIERGYQTINLAALATLKESFPSHAFWDSQPLTSAVGYVRDNVWELARGVDAASGDGLPATSTVNILSTFGGVSTELAQELVGYDVNRALDRGSMRFDVEGMHPNDQAALVSKFVDLPNLTVSR